MMNDNYACTVALTGSGGDVLHAFNSSAAFEEGAVQSETLQLLNSFVRLHSLYFE